MRAARGRLQCLCGFFDRWSVQADAAGWDTLRLFWVSPTLGTIRGDFCGIMMPPTPDVHEVTPEWIKIGRGTACRHEPVKMPGMVPVWEFGKSRVLSAGAG